MNKKPLTIAMIIMAIAIASLVVLLVDAKNEIPQETTTEEITTEEPTTKQLLYGTFEFITEIPTEEWVNGEIDFKPIDCKLDEEIQEFIYYLSFGYNIDFHFIMAVIEHESNFRADVISKTNDYGLMQINKVNHEWLSATLGITDFLDPYQNVMAGTYKFYTLFKRYGNETSKVLMAYNMGDSGARKLWNKGIYETNYSRSIMEQIAEWKEGVESD